jgi:glyoxylase-like metal-dependent hydrolase (beta-lactamase superfamily II)
MLSRITQQSEKQYGEIMWNMPFGYKGVWGYTPADALWGGWDRHPVIKALYDGQIFDLGGGRIVTVYHIAGHTPGSCVFLDHKTRIIFTGDAANLNLDANAVPVSTMIRNLLKLRNLRTEYDRMYNGHTAYAGTLDALPEDPEILDDLIQAFRSILRGDAKLEDVPNHLFPDQSKTVAIYHMVQVGFDPKRLWEPNEQHIIP